MHLSLGKKLPKYKMLQAVIQSPQRKAIALSLKEFRSRLDRTQGKEELSPE